jgi:hypothetical protein
MKNVKVNLSQVEEFKKLVHYLAVWTRLSAPRIEFTVLLYTLKSNNKPIEDVWLVFEKTHHKRVFKMYVLHDKYQT